MLDAIRRRSLIVRVFAVFLATLLTAGHGLHLFSLPGHPFASAVVLSSTELSSACSQSDSHQPSVCAGEHQQSVPGFGSSACKCQSQVTASPPVYLTVYLKTPAPPERTPAFAPGQQLAIYSARAPPLAT